MVLKFYFVAQKINALQANWPSTLEHDFVLTFFQISRGTEPITNVDNAYKRGVRTYPQCLLFTFPFCYLYCLKIIFQILLGQRLINHYFNGQHSVFLPIRSQFCYLVIVSWNQFYDLQFTLSNCIRSSYCTETEASPNVFSKIGLTPWTDHLFMTIVLIINKQRTNKSDDTIY